MRLLLCLALTLPLRAITPTPVPVVPSSLTFYSFSPVSAPTPPIGTQFLLTFPNQAGGSQNTIPSCGTYSQLQYNHYDYNLTTNVWSGPRTGNNIVTNPVMFYESTHPSGGWAGIAVNASLTGALQTNSSPTTQNFIQSFYFSTDQCFESGPEFGFYKLFTTSGSTSEENTVVFYYGVNVNCYNVGPLGSCRDKGTGMSLIYNVNTFSLTIPAFNSAGGTNFIYKAYLTSATVFHATITDPYTGLDVVTPIDAAVDPAGFFASAASQMFNGGLTGYITATQQRTSPQGALTEFMDNPFRMTIYGLAQVMLLSAPLTAATGMQPAVGWCMQGNQGVYAPRTSSNSPTQRNMQQSYASCTVSVFNAGTQNLSTIFSNNSNPPTGLSNPFQANTNGFWQFYAPNGRYTVQISGGGLSSPIIIGDWELFDYSTYTPADLIATNSIGVYGTNGLGNHVGFTAGSLSVTTLWRLPLGDAAGCLNSNGLAQLSFVSCGPAGPSGSIEFNNSGAFAGSSDLAWNNTTKVLSINGLNTGTAINVTQGFILSAGGYVSSVNNWVGYQSNTDGALLRGYHLAPSVSGTAGGYINAAPLGYANQPTPLPGLSNFGGHTGLLWVSPLNTMPGDTSQAWNSNLYINSTGGFAVCQFVASACAASPFNSMQVPNGGMEALSFSAVNYIQAGNHSGDPSPTTSDTFHAGALYYDLSAACLKVHNGSAFACISGGGGGGGSAAGPTTSIQYNSGGSLAGSANLVWSNGSQVLTATATSGTSFSIYAGTGYILSDAGFVACKNGVGGCTTGTSDKYNSIQVPGGGMAAVSFTATTYIQAGTHSGAPTVTTNDTFHAGALYWDTGTHNLMVFNESSAWVALSTGGSTSPGGATTNVQFNSAGSFGGSANFTFDSTAKLLTVIAADASHAGIAVGTGFVASDQGFLATSGTANNYNVIQAPTGGVAARSATLTTYIQPGTGASDPTVTTADTFHGGAMYYNTTNDCLKVRNNAGTFTCTGGGGGGTPGGANTNVQYNSSGGFAGSGNFTWINGAQEVIITGIAATPGLYITGGAYTQSDGGFLATSGAANNYNSIQAPTGGVAARSFTALTYTQVGFSGSLPTTTTGDTMQPGMLYFDNSSSHHTLRVHLDSSLGGASDWTDVPLRVGLVNNIATASIGTSSVTTSGAAPSGLYRIDYDVVCNSPGANGQILMAITYGGPTGAVTVNTPILDCTNSGKNRLSGWTQQTTFEFNISRATGFTFYHNSGTSSNVTYATTATGLAGATYNVYISLERVYANF